MLHVVLAGGGTGGHLFPGIALARTLSERGHAVRFLCTERPIDAAQLTREGIEFRPLASPAWKGLAGGLGVFLAALGGAFDESLADFRARPPDVVIGLGGFGCAPPVAAARVRGIPAGLLEQNVIPGKANRLLARAVRQVFCQWNEAIPRFGRGTRCLETGSPLRSEIIPGDCAAARRALGLSPDLPLLLVLGGSQGASGINAFFRSNAACLTPWREKFQILFLAGERDAAGLREAFESAGIRARVEGFRSEMTPAYQAADLAISRAGGMSLAELVRMRLPAILVPFPHSAEGHQEANARVFAAYGGLCILENELRPAMLADWIHGALLNAARLDEWRRRMAVLDRPEAALVIAETLEGWSSAF